MSEPPEDEWFINNFAQLELKRNIVIEKNIEDKIVIAEEEVQELVEAKIKLADDQTKELVIAEQKIKLATEEVSELILLKDKIIIGSTFKKNASIIKEKDKDKIVIAEEEKQKLEEKAARLAADEEEQKLEEEEEQKLEQAKIQKKIDDKAQAKMQKKIDEKIQAKLLAGIVEKISKTDPLFGQLGTDIEENSETNFEDLFNLAEQDSQKNLQDSKDLLEELFSDYSTKIKQEDAIKNFLDNSENLVGSESGSYFDKKTYIFNLMKFFKQILADNENKPLSTTDYVDLTMKFSEEYMFRQINKGKWRYLKFEDRSEMLKMILEVGEATGFNSDYQLIGNLETNLLAFIIRKHIIELDELGVVGVVAYSGLNIYGSRNNINDQIWELDDKLNLILDNSDPEEISRAIQILTFGNDELRNKDLDQLNTAKSVKDKIDLLDDLINNLNSINSVIQPTPFARCIKRNPAAGVSCTNNPRWDL